MMQGEQDDGRRLTVLIIAYACEPHCGSEPGTGWNMVTRLAESCNVTVVTRANNQHAIESELTAINRASIKFIYLDPPGTFLKLKKSGLLPTQGFYAIWQLLVAQYMWRKGLMGKFDLIHQITFNSFEIPPYAFLKKSKAKLVWGPVGGGQTVSRNQLALFGKKGGIFEFMRNIRVKLSAWSPMCLLVMRHADLVYFANLETSKMLDSWTTGHVGMLIDVGVDSSKFQPRQEGVKNVKPIILFGGRLEKRKGAILLLMSLLVLKKKGVPFECHIVGSGPEEHRLKQFIQNNQLQENIKMLGAISHAEIVEEFKLADIFAFPSLRDTSGAIVLEAMATGLPSVCIDHQGGGVMIDDNCGLKIKSANIESMTSSLADAIRRLIDDPELRDNMGRSARRKVCDEYDWDVHISHVLDGYKKVLEA